MKKISKKIVALVTMAMFVLTLVPFAAFAANSAIIDRSSFGVVQNQQILDQIEVVAGQEVTAQFILNDENGDATTDTMSNLKIWATNKVTGETTSALTVRPVGSASTVTKITGADQTVVYSLNSAASNGMQYTVSINAAGTYVLHAGYGDFTQANSKADLADLRELNGQSEFTVSANVVTSYITLANGNGGGHMSTLDANNPVSILDFTNSAVIGDFKINGTDTYTITGVAYEADNTPAVYETFTLSASRGDAVIELVNDTVTTDNAGNFSITFRMKAERNDTINIVNEDVNYAIRVIVDEDGAYDIETIKEDGYVLAGSDSRWDGSDIVRTFSGAVQFEITDEDGNVVTGDDAIASEPMQSSSVGLHSQYLTILDKPAKSALTANDLAVVWDGSAYTLNYNGAAGTVNGSNDVVASKLIPGEYTVRVALESGNFATATFNVAKYGTTQDIQIAMTAYDRSNQRDKVVITDEVTLGQNVTVTAFAIDENGIRVPARDVQYGAVGRAVRDTTTANGYTFSTKDDIVANESLIGTIITVSAYSDDETQLVQRELTVVDSFNTYGLEFAPTQGEVNADNDVTVTVVNADGVRQQVKGNLYAYVASQSNENARVVLDVDDREVSGGIGGFTVFADQETTVDIVVAVTDSNNDAIYAGTLEFTVGEEDEYAGTTVVMTIGSAEYVVNNEVVTGDAEPYVNTDFRTMVPIRALAETFGATVEYEDGVISIVDGDTTIVMTVGETAYTVNDEAATMDTAPVIGKGDRTYVPVRFVAEALGYDVTPLYDVETSLTASVVFQK